MSEDNKWKDLTRTGIFLLGWCVAGHVVLISACRENSPIPILVAFASMSVAGVLGFLFAIPRVLPEAGNFADREGGIGPKSETYRMHINTNLEQISDWLTKIAVGIGLSQLSNLPGMINRAATFMAPAFGLELG